MSSVFTKSLVIVLVVFVGCSRTRHETSHLFYGDCKVTVNAEPMDAEIMIDGIPVGHKKAKVEIPCGEKQILVEHHGFRPFYKYLTVSRDMPLDVNVKLEKIEKVEDYALSQELVEQVRNGKKLKNPFIISEEKASEKEEVEKEEPIALDFGGAAEAGGGGGTLPPGDINSVDYWR
jgi:hypothetical protein